MRSPRFLQRLLVSREQRRAWKRDLQEIAASPELDAAIEAKRDNMASRNAELWRKAWRVAKIKRDDRDCRYRRRYIPNKRKR